MILAAGWGTRMRPLSNDTPKPLIEIAGKELIKYHIEHLVKAGITDIVINHAKFRDQIEQMLGDGRAYGAAIHYSAEGEQPLETGGGIFKALPLLGDGPFIVVNSDIWCDYPLSKLPDKFNGHAYLVLVDNPDHHPKGDFALEGGRVLAEGPSMLTFSGIGVYRPELFADCHPGTFTLAPVLRIAMANGLVTGKHYQGLWADVGTPERLHQIQELAAGQNK